jgi:hypothetical protein
MTIEFARDEALRLWKEAGWNTSDFPPTAFELACVERLIALARQRPGWVWVPEDATEAMCNAAFDVRPSLANAVWHQMIRAAPKPEEGE